MFRKVRLLSGEGEDWNFGSQWTHQIVSRLFQPLCMSFRAPWGTKPCQRSVVAGSSHNFNWRCSVAKVESHSFRAAQERTKALLFGLALIWGSYSNVPALQDIRFLTQCCCEGPSSAPPADCWGAYVALHIWLNATDVISGASEPLRYTRAEAAARAHSRKNRTGLRLGPFPRQRQTFTSSTTTNPLTTKRSHRVLGVLTCLIVYALFIWISLTYCGKVYVKCWIYYAISLCSSD